MLVGLAALLVGGTVVAGLRMLSQPEIAIAPTSPSDGTRAQRKLFDLARQSRRGETVTLTEAELNALLARHLVEARGVRLTSPSTRLVGDDRLELYAQTPLRQMLDEVSLAAVADVLPRAWQARLVWLRVGAQVRVESDSRRQLRMDVDEFAVGRQRLPVPALRLLLDPATLGLLRWSLPDHVEAVSVEPGRVLIRTAS
jgi:hypothetical protein